MQYTIPIQRLNYVIQNCEKNVCFEKKKTSAYAVNCVKLKNNIIDFILFNRVATRTKISYIENAIIGLRIKYLLFIYKLVFLLLF